MPNLKNLIRLEHCDNVVLISLPKFIKPSITKQLDKGYKDFIGIIIKSEIINIAWFVWKPSL